MLCMTTSGSPDVTAGCTALASSIGFKHSRKRPITSINAGETPPVTVCFRKYQNGLAQPPQQGALSL
ncbi:hypothetical protein Pla52n_04570 [Stieleria varia]|uniref:Uncharacterized protein n=1 Tax=Stieleria varia TaxID=2528005 RepID=A0A5C6B8W3_9BACT|nr:hypothetical protein Pla52n_04570 [Stieleria varia]